MGKTKIMKRRKFLTQLTLASLGLPFIPAIFNNDFQADNFNCLSLGNMAIDTKEFFVENGFHFKTSLSIEDVSAATLDESLEYIATINFRLLLIAKPASVYECSVLIHLIKSLIENHTDFYSFIYLPFGFEGVKLKNRLENLSKLYQNHKQVKFIDLCEEGRIYGHLLWREAMKRIYSNVYYDFTQNVIENTS